MSVGYNPSSNDKLVSENPMPADFYDHSIGEKEEKLIEQINDNYFEGTTHQYFNNLETFANAFDTSYYGTKPSTAIHKDMLCYCANKDLWGKVHNKNELSAG